jgi:hypothetical protein
MANRARALEIHCDTYMTGAGEKMDLGACVDAVLDARARASRRLTVAG